MEAEQRIQALEQEVQILKTQIQSILLDIQTHLLTNAYPALRGHHTASSSPEEEDDDDEYDRAAPTAPAPKVRKVSLNSAPAKPERAMPPVAPAEPMMASLDEQQSWVLENIQNAGVSRTRDLIQQYAQQRRFTPEVSDTLMRFTDMYAAAADEPTLPSRPSGMPTVPVNVRSVAVPPAQPPKPRTPQRAAAPMPVAQTPAAPMPVEEPMRPPRRPTATAPKQAAPARPAVAQQQQQPVNGEVVEPGDEHSNVVLRLIAGVQNAGAGVRWGKNKD